MNKKPLIVLHSLDYRILYARNRDIKILQDFNDMLDSNLSLIFYGSHGKIFCKSIINEGKNYCSPIGKIIDKDDNSIERSSFYGIKFVQELRKKNHKGKVLFCSFLTTKQLINQNR